MFLRCPGEAIHWPTSAVARLRAEPIPDERDATFSAALAAPQARISAPTSWWKIRPAAAWVRLWAIAEAVRRVDARWEAIPYRRRSALISGLTPHPPTEKSRRLPRDCSPLRYPWP